jgi:hypothetical protein
MTFTSEVNDSITVASIANGLQRLGNRLQSIWSLPGVPRSQPQAWKWPAPYRLRMARQGLSPRCSVERVEMQRAPDCDIADHLQACSQVLMKSVSKRLTGSSAISGRGQA